MATTEWVQTVQATLRHRPFQVTGALAAVGFLALAGAASVAHGSGPGDPAPLASGQVLKIAFATPAPITLPPAPAADERLAVLADGQRDAVQDPGLRDSLGLAQMVALERREQEMRDRETAAYEVQDRKLQAEMAAIMRPVRASYSQAAAAMDTEVVAASGDTQTSRAATSSE